MLFWGDAANFAKYGISWPMVSEHLKLLDCTIKKPRYLSPLTHGIASPLEVRIASHEKSFLGPMRKQHDFYHATAMLSAVYAVVVCLCVTLRYCIKTAKRRITQTTQHDSPMTLFFWCQKSWRNSNEITPNGGDKCRRGGLKLVTFDEKRAITRKRYKIDA